jgi:hypothetical protein
MSDDIKNPKCFDCNGKFNGVKGDITITVFKECETLACCGNFQKHIEIDDVDLNLIEEIITILEKKGYKITNE